MAPCAFCLSTRLDDGRESIYGGMMAEPLQPFRPISPGEILNDELEARGWTKSKFAAMIGVPLQLVNENNIVDKLIYGAAAFKSRVAMRYCSQ